MRARFRVRLLLLATLLWLLPLPGRAASLPGWLHVHRCAPPCTPPAVEATVSPTRVAAATKAGYGWLSVLDATRIHLRRDGVVEEKHRQVRRFLSHEGVQDAGSFVLSVKPSVEELSIDFAYVITKAGKRVPLDPTTIQTAAESSGGVYSDRQRVVLPMPALEVGATAVLETRRRFHSKDWPIPWSRLFFLRDVAPIERFRVDTLWDPGVDAPAWATNSGELHCEQAARDRRLRCRATRLPALRSDPDIAPVGDVLPQLAVGEVRSWSELQEEIRRLVESRTRPTAAVRAKARELLAGATSRSEKLSRLSRFVATDIHYVGLTRGEHAVVPHRPDVTLSRRYGDCKDKVTLFLALARAAGIPAHAVLVGTSFSNPKKALIPALAYFDHMVACTPSSQDKEICFDLTVPNAPDGQLPLGVEGALSLSLGTQSASPAVLPAERYAWIVDIDESVAQKCDGTVHRTAVHALSGSGGLALKTELADLSKEDRRRWLKSDYRRLFGDTSSLRVSVEGLDGHRLPLLLHYETEQKRSPLVSGSVAEAAPWFLSYARAFLTENQDSRYVVSGLRLTSRIRYQLCKKAEVRFVGPSLNLETRFGRLQRTYRRRDHGIDVETRLRLPRQVVEPGSLTRYDRFLRTALAQTDIWMRLAKH